jgi:hypothetical protein
LHRTFSSMRFFIFDEFCSLRIQHVKKSWRFTYKFFIHDEFDLRRYLSIFFISCMSFVVRRCSLIKIVNANINFDIFIHFAKSLIKHHCRRFLIQFQDSFAFCISLYKFNSIKSRQSRIERVILISIMICSEKCSFFRKNLSYNRIFFKIKTFTRRLLCQSNCSWKKSHLLILS